MKGGYARFLLVSGSVRRGVEGWESELRGGLGGLGLGVSSWG